MKAKARMPLAAGMHAKLVKADFHGSIMTGSSSRLSRHHYFDVDTVRKSKNAALVGVSGIVVQETENTFKVVTRKDKLKGACASPLLPSCLLSVYLSLLYLSPQIFFYSSAKARV